MVSPEPKQGDPAGEQVGYKVSCVLVALYIQGTMSYVQLQERPRMAIWIWGNYELFQVTIVTHLGLERRSLAPSQPNSFCHIPLLKLYTN